MIPCHMMNKKRNFFS